MTGKKEGKFLTFYLDDGSTIRYDLSTGEQIGVKGKPVKSVAYKTKGYGIQNFISSIDDVNYQNFLRFVYGEIPSHIKNFSCVLKHAKEYSNYEQIFSSGIKKVSRGVNVKSISSLAISLCRRWDLILNYDFCFECKIYPNLVKTAFDMLESEEFHSLNASEIQRLFGYRTFIELINERNYNEKSLLRYIDGIMTYEAVSPFNTVLNLSDYARMMSQVSNKYEKYPKHLLTSHQIAIRTYQRLRQQFEESNFLKRVNHKMDFRYKDWAVIYPDSTQDIKDEAVQQNNCVASYIQDVIDGKCDIVFLRKIGTLNKSLVTVEVRDGKVVQCRGKYNRECTPEELDVLTRYETYLKNLKDNKD